jgi:hypothetical protein
MLLSHLGNGHKELSPVTVKGNFKREITTKLSALNVPPFTEHKI